MTGTITNPRPSPIAGLWYPGEPRVLTESIDHFLSQAQLPEAPGQILAVVAPHAGHRFSGAVAGHAFAALRGLEPELVAIIAPMHHAYNQPLLTTAHDAYKTPLGSVPVDQVAIQTLHKYLQQSLGFGLTPILRDAEHSLEIELPFLQRALKNNFSILPVMMRDQRPEVAQAIGDALAKMFVARNAILVASSDLSHFYPQQTAQELDKEVLERLAAQDPAGLLQAEIEGTGFACGRGAIAAVLWAAQQLGGNSVKILNYATSGDITGDYSAVVGYGAAAIYRK
jgi:AmmeMemoRadiSam system protein B